LARRTKGEGSIYFSNNRWVAQITLPNGKRKSKSNKNKSVVLDWLIAQRGQLQKGLFIDDEKIKVGEYLDRYTEDVASHNLRPRSLTRHISLINNHIKPEIGNIRLSALRPDHVQRLYSKKLNEGLSPRTVQYIHAVLHKSLNQAVKWGLVARNVSNLVEKPRPKKKTFKTWNVKQVKQFLSAVADHRYYPIYLLAVFSGMRQGEILGLYHEDIRDCTIHVKRQVSAIAGQGLVITEPKTEKARRPISITPEVAEALGEGEGLIFKTRSGRPISPRNLLRHFKSVIAQEGLPEIRFHDLRHFHATALLTAGVHPKVVQERLGHSQISLTLDTYSHVIPSMQEEAIDKFTELFK
jgi:integrase